jgi:hypothetical protein
LHASSGWAWDGAPCNGRGRVGAPAGFCDEATNWTGMAWCTILPPGRFWNPGMFVHWQNSKSVARWNARVEKINRCRAVLIERIPIDGKCKATYVATIASYVPDGRNPIMERRNFWKRARERLDKLCDRVTPEDRAKIEAALALRVPPTTPQEEYQAEREGVESMVRLWQSLTPTRHA